MPWTHSQRRWSKKPWTKLQKVSGGVHDLYGMSVICDEVRICVRVYGVCSLTCNLYGGEGVMGSLHLATSHLCFHVMRIHIQVC